MIVRILTRLLAWALYRRLRREIHRPDLRRPIDRELGEIQTTLSFFADNQISEVGILTERLGRRFDPGMALNEAANRALEAKAAYNEPNVHRVTGSSAELTAAQQEALEFQKKYLKRIVRES